MTRYITLRKVGGSLHMSVPAEFVRACGLSPGDSVRWNATDDMAMLKFFKVTVNRTPALEKQGEEVAAESA